MPVIGVIGMVMGLEAGIGTLMGGLMFAGGALSAIGSITGNKDLSNIGGILSLGAGVANFATSIAEGATTATDMAAGEATGAASGGDSMWSSLGQKTASQAAAVTGEIPQVDPTAGTSGASNLVNNSSLSDLQSAFPGSEIGKPILANEAMGGSQIPGSPLDATAASGMGNPAGLNETPKPAMANQDIGGNPLPDTTGGTSSGPTGDAAANWAQQQGVSNSSVIDKLRQGDFKGAWDSATSGDKNILSGLGGFLKDNKELVGMIGKGAEALLQKPLLDARANSYNAESTLNNTRADQLRAQMTNANNVGQLNIGMNANPGATNIGMPQRRGILRRNA